MPTVQSKKVRPDESISSEKYAKKVKKDSKKRPNLSPIASSPKDKGDKRFKPAKSPYKSPSLGKLNQKVSTWYFYNIIRNKTFFPAMFIGDFQRHH